MLENMQTSLEEGVSAVDRFERRIQNAFARLVNHGLILLQHAAERLEVFSKRAAQYLRRLAQACYRLVIALSKLGLFYLPGLCCWLFELKFFAVLWCAAVTAAGLFYQKNEVCLPEAAKKAPAARAARNRLAVGTRGDHPA